MIPEIGYALICDNAEYYSFTPNAANPPEITPCATLLNGNPITFDCEGSAFDPGNPPTKPARYYVWQGNDLYYIDPAVPCGQNNVTLVAPNVVAGPVIGSTLSFANGMATLWAIDLNTPSTLYEIDPSNGMLISSRQLTSCDDFSPEVLVGIAFDPVSGKLFGIGDLDPNLIFEIFLPDNCIQVCFININGGPNDSSLQADGFSIDANGVAYIEGDVDPNDDNDIRAIYSVSLPSACFMGPMVGDTTIVATYEMQTGNLGTVAFNGTACLQECPEITCEIINITDAMCFDSADGTAQAAPTGGAEPYAFLWDNGETNGIATMLAPGAHTVTITDANNCIVICDEFIIGSPPELTCTISEGPKIICPGDSNGSLTVIPSGGAGNYTIQWSNNEVTNTIVNLTAGIYSVTITDINNCQTSCDFTLAEPPALTCVATNQSDVLCFGESNGRATVTPSGGTGSYTYSWSNGEMTQNATQLPAGLNEVTVTDANMCITSCVVGINQPTELSCSIQVIMDVQCAGDTNGSAIVTPVGGTGEYTYLWDNDEVTQTAVMLDGGQHFVTVTDENMCTTTCMITIADVSGLSCTVDLVQNISCNGLIDGSATAMPSGGVADYTYEWDNGEIVQTAIALSPGEHMVTVTDSNDCSTICSITIIEPEVLTCSITIDQNLNCFGENIGQATATAVGGTGPFTYMWDDGQTTAIATGLDAGEVSVSITDANACITQCSATILSPPELTCSVILNSNISCFGEIDGSATVEAQGGIGPYTYEWDNGEVTETAVALPEGVNTVTVTDSNMCVTSCTITIIEPAELTCEANLINDVVCEGELNGSAIANPSGGTMPFSYLWDNNETTQTATMLGAGMHTVTLTDVNNCMTTCTVLIGDQSTLECMIQLDSNISCFDADDAALTVIPTGGNMPYSVEWSTGQITTSITDVSPGIITVTVTDNNNCTTSCMITISEPDLLSCEISLVQEIICFGDENGSASITPMGGTPDYTYLWDNMETTQTAVNLTAGLHTVTITDANNCTNTCVIDIPGPPDLTCQIVLVNNISCTGENDGSATVIVTGGTADYTFLWSTGETGATATQLIPGTNSITVTDMNNCETTCLIDIIEPLELTCVANLINDVVCEGELNGSAEAVPSGGTMPFTYLWDNNETTATATMLSAGIHTVTVTDDNACTTTCMVEIQDQSTLECSIQIDATISCFEANDGELTVLPVGGNMPYTYEWSTSQTSSTITNVGAGIISVTVTDANNCTSTCMVTMTQPDLLTCEITLVQAVNCFADSNGSATITQTGGTPGYTYLWDNLETTQTAVNLTAGLHTATVTDMNDCVSTCTIEIPGPEELTCEVSLVNNISCFGESDGSASAIFSGGTPDYEFMWSTGEITSTAVSLVPGTNSVTITDLNGCTTTCMIDIVEPLEFTCSVVLVNNALCIGEATGSATALTSNGIAPFEYLWDNDEDTATATMLSVGVHTVTITDDTGCISTCQIEIMDQTELVCAVSLVNNVSCNGFSDGSAMVTAMGGVSPYSFEWDNMETGSTAIALAAGTTTVTVTDANNCTSICDIIITEPPLLECSTTLVNDITCFGDDDGSATVSATGGTPDYIYLWDNGQTTETATGLTPGTHFVTITDANLCEVICDIFINEPEVLACEISLVNDISCFGANDGSATATATGGNLGYTYLWDDNQTTQTAVNLTPGLHTVTVTDLNNCTTVCDITILEPLEFTCTANLVSNVSCAGETDGSATAIPTGGVSPFSYLWDNNETTATALMLSGGNHTVTITDDTGCTTICAINIMDQSMLECSITIEQDVSCNGGSDGSATATSMGGLGNYTYLWDNDETTATAVNLTAGTHTVTVSDINGCGTTCIIDIGEPPVYTCALV